MLNSQGNHNGVANSLESAKLSVGDVRSEERDHIDPERVERDDLHKVVTPKETQGQDRDLHHSLP